MKRKSQTVPQASGDVTDGPLATPTRKEVVELEESQEAISRHVPGPNRVRLCCDISRGHHRRLRMTAVLSDRTILEVVEEMIDRYCATEHKG